jgi:hypothetical protein
LALADACCVCTHPDPRFASFFLHPETFTFKINFIFELMTHHNSPRRRYRLGLLKGSQDHRVSDEGGSTTATESEVWNFRPHNNRLFDILQVSSLASSQTRSGKGPLQFTRKLLHKVTKSSSTASAGRSSNTAAMSPSSNLPDPTINDLSQVGANLTLGMACFQ